jgi:hypothetical protein
MNTFYWYKLILCDSALLELGVTQPMHGQAQKRVLLSLVNHPTTPSFHSSLFTSFFPTHTDNSISQLAYK